MMGLAKKWVQRPHFRSKVEVDRKKESKRKVQDDGDWIFWIDDCPNTWYHPPNPTGWIDHNNDKGEADDKQE